jgi:hypothetical protein
MEGAGLSEEAARIASKIRLRSNQPHRHIYLAPQTTDFLQNCSFSSKNGAFDEQFLQ